MDWTKFNNHGESNNHAFEVMCNLLFESWCKKIYKDELEQFVFVNGDGGDGGVEAYGILKNGVTIAVQSKWFPEKIKDSQINQIKSSFQTAIKIRPSIRNYIVCIPRDLGSKKVVKGGGIASNTERDKWEQFVLDCNSINQDIKITLWDETTLQDRLTNVESQGIYKYWFENTIIFDELFTHSYEKTINGWAKHNYIPDIHTAGHIHEYLEKFLGSGELTKLRYEKVCKVKELVDSLLRAYNDLLEIGIPENTIDLKCKIQKDLPILQKWDKLLENNKDIIKCGGISKLIIEPFELNCHPNDIKGSSLHFGKYFHLREVENLLENVEDEFSNLIQLLDNGDDNKIIFLGVQGTGKTAGIVAEATKFMHNKLHLPIIIHAKEFSSDDTWTSIITRTLGLETTWNEIELFQALQNASFLRGYNNHKIGVESKCVIIVDGIDESTSWKFWIDKINETKAYQKLFPRIKFVFLSRPYVFSNRYKLPYRSSFYQIPSTGDGNLEEICNKYFAAYEIDIGGNTWIKQNFKSPAAIKLFCDIYQGQRIVTLPYNTVVLTELYKAKIASLEEVYGANHKEIIVFNPIQTALIELAEMFTKSDFIRYEDIYDKVSAQLKGSLTEMLDFLMNEGFIYTVIKQEDEFSKPETFYSWGMQPAFDYLIAQKVYNSLNAGETVEIHSANGIYQMLSLISIERGKLIIEYSNVKVSNHDAFELICYALANCSIGISKKYSEYLIELMRSSVAQFREIFNNVILPVIKIDGHPLGAELLDEFLREFDNSSERDIWWSIPSYLRNSYDAEWYSYTEMDFESINLESTDEYYGAPLVLAWSLSSVNNHVRQRSRFKLTKWGISKSMEFWRLLEKCISINDMQIIEDIFSIAYGIALDQFVCEEYLHTASIWILENLFSDIGLKKYENVVVRYYGTGIVKIAYAKGLLDEQIIQIVIPPYNYEPDFLKLHKEALSSTRMGGYKAIDYDLARYVLCDRLDGYFRVDYKTKEYHKNANKFIERYKDKYKLPEFKIDGLIIAMAYQYLLNQGWSINKFWLSNDENKSSVDCAIRGTYYPATHGEKSKIMTVAEKNVWLAKHQIEAIFANEIPLCDDYRDFEFVEDYSKLENFINTYQDLSLIHI